MWNSGSPSTTRSSSQTQTSPTSSTSIISPATSTSTSTDQSLDTIPWILHQVLEPQTTCELPVSIMFSINSGKSLPRLKDVYSWWQLDRNGKLVLAFLSSQDRITPSIADATAADIKNPLGARAEPDFDPIHCPDDRFMDRGNEKLLKIGFAHFASNNTENGIEFEPSRGPRGLPPHFIKKYCVEQVFIKNFGSVNFDHALTAIDYLRDLEVTRRDTLRETAENFGITQRNWRNVLGGNPNALAWVEQTQGNELRIETLYSNLFLDLRIWTMTSILLSNHFYKQEALAMLNTLFPPSIQELPTAKINPKTLYQQRAIFYRYILDVAANGPGIIMEFEKKLNQFDNRHNWLAVRVNMEKYLDLAAKMIDQAKVANEMLRLRRVETPDHSDLTTSRSFSGTSFDSIRPKTPKSKGSLTDMRARFGFSKKPSKVFGEAKPAFSKSMVNVNKSDQEKPNQSMVDVISRKPDNNKLDHSRSIPATTQPRLDSLLSLQARGIAKPMGFVPPPLAELEKILGRTLTPSFEDDEADSMTTANSTPRVSFDFDAELGLGNTYRRPSLSSDLQPSDQPKKPKPSLQIDTEGITSRQPPVSAPIKSAQPLLKLEKPGPIPTAVRPQAAESSGVDRHILRYPASSSKLFSASSPPPFESPPPLATLPIKRRQIPEPAMMPEPLDIDRIRKASTPGTSNLSSFPPRTSHKDQALSSQSLANKNSQSELSSERIDLTSQEFTTSTYIRKTPSATALRPSISSETSSTLSVQNSIGSATQPHLLSDNYDFLNRPYSGASQENNQPPQVIMKKPSFTALFSRKKKSSPALKDEFQADNAFGVSAESNDLSTPRESGEARPIIKKKASFAFGGGMSNSDSHGKIDSQDKPERSIKKMASFVFGTPSLRTSDSQATLRPEPRVLHKKRSKRAVTEPSEPPQLPPLPRQSSFVDSMPMEEESAGGDLSTSFSSSKSPTSPLAQEFVPSPSPSPPPAVVSGSVAAPQLKKKKSVWGFVAKKEMTVEEVEEKEREKEEKRRAKEEKREREKRDFEEGVFAVAEFFVGEEGLKGGR